MMSPNPRRSPRQQSSTSTRRSIGGAGTSLTVGLMPGTPSRRGENIPLQPSPLRNEISASTSKAKSRKRARSLGGNGGDDPLAPSSAKQINPRKKRMTIAPARGILKKAGEETFTGGHTVIGVIQQALKEEKAREEETDAEIARRRELRKSLNRRVSFASHATIRLFPQAGTPTTTPSPKKGVGFAFDGSPSTDNDSTGELSPQSIPHTPSPVDLPRTVPPTTVSPGSDSEETSMDIADDNLTLPLPSALIKRQLQRGVGFQIDDGESEEEEMDVTQPLGGIIPPRDGVNRFLSGEDDDQTMELTQIYQPNDPVMKEEDDTMGMEFTKVVGKIKGPLYSMSDKENLPPQIQQSSIDEVTMDMTHAIGSILSKQQPNLEEEDDDNDTQPMDLTFPLSTLRTPAQQTISTPDSSPFYNSPIRPQPAADAEITRSPLSTGLTGTPKRTPQKGLVAIDLLTGTPLSSSAVAAAAAAARRKSDSGVILGSPRAAKRLSSRASLAGVHEFAAETGSRRVSIGREAWHAREFGGEIRSSVVQETGIRDMIARMTPRKVSRVMSPGKSETPRRNMMGVVDELMLTPGMMKREFGPKVANLVKIWEDNGNPSADDGEDDFPPITLAEFLSMTNISFLDGLGPSSTRRRTVVPPEGLATLKKPEFADYAKAGAVSIPMLELYQFSCQNASKYIEEGKAMIEGIEQDTLEDPPLLFREYVGAPPDLKRIMDSQFKLLKTWARLKAKGGWYSWRDQLLGGVMPTLTKNAEGLRKDKLRLRELRGQLEPLFPGIKEQHAIVKSQLDTLRNQREEIEMADQEELRRVREEISIVSEGLEMRRVEMEAQEKDATQLSAEEAELRKHIEECRIKIDRAERVKELNRGFEKNEVEGFKDNLQHLIEISGWSITRVQGSKVEMILENEVIISFDIQELAKGGSAKVRSPKEMDPIRQFSFSALTPESLKGDVRKILNTVSRVYHLTRQLRTELALIKSKHPITLSSTDASLIINVCLLLPSARTKFHCTFTISNQFFEGKGINVDVERKYGELDLNEVRRTVEGRVRSGGIGCMRGACEEVWEVWE